MAGCVVIILNNYTELPVIGNRESYHLSEALPLLSSPVKL